VFTPSEELLQKPSLPSNRGAHRGRLDPKHPPHRRLHRPLIPRAELIDSAGSLTAQQAIDACPKIGPTVRMHALDVRLGGE
jgi:hypothetical protein